MDGCFPADGTAKRSNVEAPSTLANDNSAKQNLETSTNVLLPLAPFGYIATRNNETKLLSRKQRVEWTPREDAILYSLIPKKIKPQERIWKGLASKFNELSMATPRSAKDCRERWQNVLDPKLMKRPWSVEEVKIIEQMYNSFGPKWAAMAKILNGRSERDIKNIWNSRQRQSRSMKTGSASTADAATILRPSLSGTPIFPPAFSLDPIERPRTLRMPLSVDTRELDVADTLSQSFARRDENRDIFQPQRTLLPSWTAPLDDANSPRDFSFDDFKALEHLCEKWN